MTEYPTLKVRFEVPGNNWGRECHEVAARMVDGTDVTVLDAKWGRTPSDWRESQDWGRKRLTDRQRGYIEGVAATSAAGDPVWELLAIIDSLTSTPTPKEQA